MPPACTARRLRHRVDVNEAAQNIEGWKTRSPKRPEQAAVDDLRSRLLDAAKPEPADGLADKLRGTGPCNGAASPALPLQPWPCGRTRAAAAQLGALGTWSVVSETAVTLTLCGKSHAHLRHARAAPSFTAQLGGTTDAGSGALADRRQHVPLLLEAATRRCCARRRSRSSRWWEAPARPRRSSAMSRGRAHGPGRATGRSASSWRRARHRGARARGQRRVGATYAADAIFADFAARSTRCACTTRGARMRSVRKADGDVVGVDFGGTADSSNPNASARAGVLQVTPRARPELSVAAGCRVLARALARALAAY